MLRKYASVLAIGVCCVVGEAEAQSNAPGPERETCPASLPAGLVCEAGAAGVAVASTSENAKRYAQAIDDAAVRFERHFARRASPAALVEPSTQFDAVSPLLRSRVVFPWLAFGPDMVAATVDRIKAARPTISAEQIAAITKSEFQKTQAREVGAVSHEFCHLWLIHEFGFKMATGENRHYGGDAPDWLDETAAVLCESDTLTSDRRMQMGMLRKGVLPWKLWTLAEFTSVAHPLAQKEAQLLQGGAQKHAASSNEKGQGYFRRLSGDEAKDFIGSTNAPAFYVQARAFADFLVEKSGRPDIFAEIANAATKQISFESWLKKEGKRANLPESMDELQVQWEDWLNQSYPAV